MEGPMVKVSSTANAISGAKSRPKKNTAITRQRMLQSNVFHSHHFVDKQHFLHFGRLMPHIDTTCLLWSSLTWSPMRNCSFPYTMGMTEQWPRHCIDFYLLR